MAEPEPSGLDELLGRMRFMLRQWIDFRRADTVITLATVRLLAAVAEFGGRAGSARHPGLVEHVVGAAFQTFGGEDPYAEPFDRAAALLRGITQGHPVTDGNKRTGILFAAYYLDLVGWSTPARTPVDEVVTFCRAVSAGEIRDVEEMSAQLRRLWGR